MPECPQCFRRVIPSADGICPNCQQDVGQVSQERQTKTTIVISITTRFPARCHLCNTPTESLHKETLWSSDLEYRDNQFGGLQLLFSLLIAPFFPLFILFGRQAGWRRTARKTVLEVPMCDLCNGSGVTVIELDPDSGRIRLVVDRDFADLVVQSQNPRASF